MPVRSVRFGKPGCRGPKARHWLLGAPLLWFGTGSLAGQETSRAVQGGLRSSSGDPVVSARLTATSPVMLGARRTVSADDGVFTLLALPPGTHALRIAAFGRRPFSPLWVPGSG